MYAFLCLADLIPSGVTHLSGTEAYPLIVKSGERCTPTGVLAP